MKKQMEARQVRVLRRRMRRGRGEEEEEEEQSQANKGQFNRIIITIMHFTHKYEYLAEYQRVVIMLFCSNHPLKSLRRTDPSHIRPL